MKDKESEILKLLTEEERKIYLLKLKNFSDKEIKETLNKKNDTYKTQKRSMQKKIDSLINSSYRMLAIPEITWMSKRELYDQSILIDSEAGCIQSEQDLSTDLWLKMQADEEGMHFLMKGENPVGYWYILTLNDVSKQFAGTFSDIDFTGKNEVVYPLLPGFYHLYVLCFAILAEHRNVANFKLMYLALLKQVEKYADNDIYFYSITCNACSELGESFCNTLKMQYICDHIEGGRIYNLDLRNIDSTKNLELAAPSLIKKYKDKGIIK